MKAFLLILFFSFCAHAENLTWSLEGFSSPESVIKVNQALYVSNVGEKLAPSVKDGDGYISKVSLDGKLLEKNAFPSLRLNAPKAMALVNQVLYVADVDRVVGVSLKTKKKVSEISFQKEKAVFLNDLCVLDSKTLLVSATDLHKIFTINLTAKKNKVVELKTTQKIEGPNGMVYDSDRKMLYVAGYGVDSKPNGGIYSVDLSKKDPVHVSKKISELQGYFDGIGLIGSDVLIVSDWVSFEGEKGKIISVDLADGHTIVHETVALKGPADFYFDWKKKEFFIPNMMAGKLISLKSFFNLDLGFKN